jgi:predicted ATPase
MQQAARRPAAGERLQIRVGLQVGEALRHDATDYFGTTVVIASRLCALAGAGEILCSSLVRTLIADASAFDFRDRGELKLKGVTSPVATGEVVYEPDPLAMLTVTPFVGREAESAALRKKLDDARAEQGGVAMLVGEPGIGKTRTIEEFCTHARSQGVRVLSGCCYEGDWAPPFSPFAEALRDYVSDAPIDELQSLDVGDLVLIARIVPAIRERLPDINEPPVVQTEGERYRLLEAVARLLGRLAAHRPLVLVLDDLHWADKATIAMLRHVARNNASKAVLLLGAYRDVELDRQHPLAAALADLRRETAFERIPLKGLAAGEVGELLDVIAEQDVPRALVDAIASETNGNPFFIGEVLLHLIEERKIFQEDGRWTSTLPIAEIGIPEGVREVIGRRLSRLSEGCNCMLTTASAMTGGFSWAELQAICEESEKALLDALDEALRAQVLVEPSAGTYDFMHALIRHTLYEELSTPRRVLLHRQIGEALELVHSANFEPHLSELAHHFYEAASGGDVAKAIDYARRAGDRAMAQVAWEGAVADYERALETMDLLPGANEEVRIDTLLALGRALNMVGAGRDRWRPIFLRAAELSRRTGDSERLARAALGFADLEPNPGVVDTELIRLLEESLELQGSTESALRARMLARMANELSFSDERLRKTQLLRVALRIARRVDDPETLAYVLSNHMWEDISAAQGLSLAREQLAAASRVGDKFAELWAHHALSGYVLRSGDRDGFDQTVDDAGRLERELHITDFWLGLQRALQLQMDGQFDEAERWATQAFADLQRDDPGNAAQGLGAAILSIRRHQGRLLELVPAIKVNAEQYPSVPGWAAALALVQASDTGQLDDARIVFDRLAARGFVHLPADSLLPSTLSSLAEVCFALGDSARAPELYRMLLPHDGEWVVIGWANAASGAVSRSLALLAATMRRWDDAERHFEDALRTTEQLGDKPWLVQTRAQYGAVLLERGTLSDRAHALDLLRLALAAAREMGMKKAVEDCLALELQANPVDQGAGPDALTKGP